MDGADVTEMGERVSAGIRRMNDIMPNIWGFFQFLAKNIWGFFRFLAKKHLGILDKKRNFAPIKQLEYGDRNGF